MAKRVRSSSPSIELPLCSASQRARHIEPSIHEDASQQLLVTKKDILDRVRRVLDSADEGVWLRILPLHDDNDSIYYHTGQEWANRLPCLLSADLLRLVSGKLQVRVDQWKMHFGSPNNFEIGSFQPFTSVINGKITRGKRAYFITKKPTSGHKNPEGQCKDSEFVVKAKDTVDARMLNAEQVLLASSRQASCQYRGYAESC